MRINVIKINLFRPENKNSNPCILSGKKIKKKNQYYICIFFNFFKSINLYINMNQNEKCKLIKK